MKKTIIILILLTTCLQYSVAEESYKLPNNFWKGLLAENISGGYEGLYSITCCYRNRLNRGMSLGCEGLHRKDLDRFIEKQLAYGKSIGVDYEKMIKDIIQEVFKKGGKDVTFGSTHYENIEKFGVPWWAKDMIVTVKIKGHTFYKEK